MSILLFFIYFIGWFVAARIFIKRTNAGSDTMPLWKHPLDGTLQLVWYLIVLVVYNFVFFGLVFVKCWVWPGVLAVWLYNGRPQSAWQADGYKAARGGNQVVLIKRTPIVISPIADQSRISAPLGSGRRLRSDLEPTQSLTVLKQLILGYGAKNKRRYISVTPGWIWNNSEEPAPDKVITFTDENDDFLLAAIWKHGASTEYGLFPLESGDERLDHMTIIGHWKQKDSSLTSIGRFPGGTISLTTPTITEKYFVEILKKGRYPATLNNIDATGKMIGQMFLIKASEFLRPDGQKVADEFIANHSYNGEPRADYCKSVLNDLVILKPGVLPYIQDLPSRCRAILLRIEVDGEVSKDSFWGTLEH